jgi:hypothetical protein
LANDVWGGLVAYGIYLTDSDPVFAHISAFGTPTAYYSPPPELPAVPLGVVTDHRDVVFGAIVCGVISTYPWTANAQLEALTAFACGYGGDGGPASEGTMNGPVGVAFDSKGWIYVADTGNNAIRVLYPDAIFTADMEQ